jgi:hypothetical protein
VSSPPRYKPSTWRHDRLVEVMDARGINEFGLRELLIRERVRQGKPIVPIQLKTIRAWMAPGQGAMMGRTAFVPAAFEIADALDLSLDWLLGRVDEEPRVPGKRKRGGA